MFDGEPELQEDLEPYWNMWNDLHQARPVGFGASPIPYSDVYAWLEIHGYHLSQWEREEHVKFFYAMEDEWLAWARKKESDAEEAEGTG